MDLWSDLVSPVVGAALAVSTIFFPLLTVTMEASWYSQTNATISAEQ
jgi:hypothetical protein